MRPTTARIVEALLAAGAAALVAVLAAPWPAPRPAATAETAARIHPGEEVRDTGGLPRLPPSALVGLFPSGPVAPAPRPPAPAEAPWLRYVGSSRDGTKASWYVKDTRSGRIMSLTTGVARAGWRVVEDRGGLLVVGDGDTLYAVTKR